MLKMLRLYSPAIVIALWSILVFIVPLGHEVRAVAWLSVAVALKISIDETRRQYRNRQDRQ